MLIIKKFLIAGGNSTLLVWNCPAAKKDEIISKYLGDFEQIGFVKQNKLVMMGSELCINSTLALASVLDKNGFLYTSGINSRIYYSNEEDNTKIQIKLPIYREENIIIFSGIGFLCTQRKLIVTRKMLANLARKYRLPAFGIALYQNNRLTPYVYVKQTNTLFIETACGSASIATGITTGINKIIQPTGEVIEVFNENEEITVSARVRQLRD